MHDCIYCERACDCDGDDTWLNTPDNCRGCGDLDCESGREDWWPEDDELSNPDLFDLVEMS